MKQKNFSKKTIYLSCIFLVIIIICGTFYLDAARSSMNQENADAIPMQRQKLEKEIEVKQALCDYDKDNIVEVCVFLEDSDNGVISANILVVSNDEITDVDERDKIRDIASGCLNVDAQNISLGYMDSETFSEQETKVQAAN